MATQLRVTRLNASGGDKTSNADYGIFYNITTYPTYVTIRGYSYLGAEKSDTSASQGVRVTNGAVSVAGASVVTGRTINFTLLRSKTSDLEEKSFTFTKDVTRDHSAKTVTITASGELRLTGSYGDAYSGPKSASASISVPAKPSYAVSYNANGGTNGMPSAQTKWHDESLTLQADNGYRKVVSEAGEPTKEYVLSSWNTKADGTGTAYALGGTYTGNAAITLYAVWELKYIYPTITNLKVYRTATSSISDVDEDDLGEYIFVSFDWTKCSEDGSNLNITPNCKITINSDEYTPTLTSSFKFKSSATYSSDAPVSVSVELYDQSYASSRVVANENTGTSILPIDLYGSGTNVYMGVMTPHVQGQELTLTESLYIGANKLADFVVEQGTSGLWTYRKWNSGIAECWGQTSVASRQYAANGGHYNVTENLPSGLFNASPNIVIASGRIATVVQTDIGFTSPNNANVIQTYLINRNSSAVTQAGAVYWMVKGRWK